MLKFKWETEFKQTEIGEIPKRWEVETLKWAVSSLECGNRPKGGALKHDPNGILSIGGENIDWQGDLILDGCLRFKRDFYDSLNRGKIEKDDILLVKDGATIGKLAFIRNVPDLLIDNYKTGNITYWTNEKQPFCNELDIVIVADGESSGKLLRFQSGILGSTLLALKPKMKIKDIENYIYLMLRSIEDNLIEHRTGSAIPHLDKDYLLNLKVAIPPQPVFEKFYSLVEPLFQKIITNQKQIMVLRKVRDLLLPLLVFGKLRVEEL